VGHQNRQGGAHQGGGQQYQHEGENSGGGQRCARGVGAGPMEDVQRKGAERTDGELDRARAPPHKLPIPRPSIKALTTMVTDSMLTP